MALSLQVVFLQDPIEAYGLRTGLLFNHKEATRQMKRPLFLPEV